MSSVNIPGNPIWQDAESGRLLTVDYQHHIERGATEDECQAWLYGIPLYFDAVTGECFTIERSLVLLDVSSTVATSMARAGSSLRGRAGQMTAPSAR